MDCVLTHIKQNTSHACHDGRHAREVQAKRICTRLGPGSPQRRRPARCAGLMEEACSSQEAVTHSVEACTAGGPKKKQGLCSIVAVVTKETEPTSMRQTNTHVHSCIQTHTCTFTNTKVHGRLHECACTRACMNAHARVHSLVHTRVHG